MYTVMYKRECMSSNYTSQKYRAHFKAMLQVLKEGVPTWDDIQRKEVRGWGEEVDYVDPSFYHSGPHKHHQN